MSSPEAGERVLRYESALSGHRHHQIRRLLEKIPDGLDFVHDGLAVTTEGNSMGQRQIQLDGRDELGAGISMVINPVYDETYGHLVGVSAKRTGGKTHKDGEEPQWEEHFSSFSAHGNNLRPKEIVKALRKVKHLAKKQ